VSDSGFDAVRVRSPGRVFNPGGGDRVMLTIGLVLERTMCLIRRHQCESA
jgi:hypothetical protein